MYKLFGYLSYPKVRLVFCCTLTLPLALMVNSIPDVFRGKDNTRVLAGQGMKLMEVYLESLPQSLLQGFIILQVLHGGTAGVPVDWKQWTSLAISIISLAFSIAMGHMCAQKATDIPGTDQYPVKDPSSISQAVFFVLGGLSISARILVCSLWALISKPLWCVPCLCNVAIAVTFWCTRRFYTDSLSVYTHNMYTLSAKGIVTLIWITTALFNGFTPSGAFVSAGNLSLAVGGYFLVDLPDTNVDLVCIIAIVLSTVSLAANLLVILVPAFRRTIGDDMLLIERIGRSTFY